MWREGGNGYREESLEMEKGRSVWPWREEFVHEGSVWSWGRMFVGRGAGHTLTPCVVQELNNIASVTKQYYFVASGEKFSFSEKFENLK